LMQESTSDGTQGSFSIYDNVAAANRILISTAGDITLTTPALSVSGTTAITGSLSLGTVGTPASGIIFLGSSDASHRTQINVNGNAIAGVTNNLIGLAQEGVAWLMAMDTSGNMGIAGKLSTENSTQNTVNTMLVAGFGGDVTNRSIVVQQIFNATTSNQFLFLNGSLGSSSAVGAPTLTSTYASAFGFEADDSNLYLLTAAPGTNVTPTTAMTMDISGNMGIAGKLTANTLRIEGLPSYANNAAATTAGLTAGDCYRDGGDPDHVCVVH
jgi:hypothetical protein